MLPISEEDFRNLSAYAIAQRIDAFFDEDHINRYGPFPIHQLRVRASSIFNSATVQAMDETGQKRALLLFHRAVFQEALSLQYGGFQNRLIHSDQRAEAWNNPVTQVSYAALRQAAIISGRIAFECMMEFVYFVEEKGLIKASRSKSRAFRKWLCRPQNRFGWLIFYMLVIQRYDRNHRTPEVHGTSSIAIEALRCPEWPRLDSELVAINISLNIWRSIVDVLNGGANPGYSCAAEDIDLFRDFPLWKEINLSDLWNRHASQTESAD